MSVVFDYKERQLHPIKTISGPYKRPMHWSMYVSHKDTRQVAPFHQTA